MRQLRGVGYCESEEVKLVCFVNKRTCAPQPYAHVPHQGLAHRHRPPQNVELRHLSHDGQIPRKVSTKLSSQLPYDG
jgi:hypothetical protein